MLAVVASPIGDIVLMNTHIDASGDDRWRKQEIKTIIALTNAELAAGARRLFFGGDFNSTPESAVQAELRANGMNDAWAQCGRGNGMTYPADSSRKRIDYLFVEAGAECTDAAVLVTQASDHRPVLFTLHVDADR